MTEPSLFESGEQEIHGLIRDFIWKCHKATFGIACQWNGREGKLLSRMIDENRSWALDDWQRMVRNRYESYGVTPDRPALWLGNVSRWSCSPLDKYGRSTAHSENGNGKKQNIIEAIRNSREFPSFE